MAEASSTSEMDANNLDSFLLCTETGNREFLAGLYGARNAEILWEAAQFSTATCVRLEDKSAEA